MYLYELLIGVFLHDPRLICSATHSTTRQKNKEDNVIDTFFWPASSSNAATKNMEHNFHPYSVPAPKNDQYKLHDQALYSMYMYHVDFCRSNSKAQKGSDGRNRVVVCEDLPINVFTHRERLPVFQLLSRSLGQSIAPHLSTEAAQHRQLQQLKLENALALKRLEALQQKAAALNHKTVPSVSRSGVRSPTSATASALERAFETTEEYSSSGHTSSCCSSVGGEDEDDEMSSLSSEEGPSKSRVNPEVERRRLLALSIVSKSEAIQMAGKAALHAQSLHFQQQGQQQHRYVAYR